MSVVVLGGANMDLKARSARPVRPATSNPGHAETSAGGVGRNVAENLARLGTPTHLVAAVGADALGDRLLAATAGAGVDVAHVRRGPHPTGTYTAVLDADGELVVAVSDMRATDALAPADVDGARALVLAADLVVLDGNLAPATLAHALDLAAAAGVRVVLEPVSVPKAERLRDLLEPGRPVHVVTPNRDELAALGGDVDALHACGATWVWVRLGAEGSLLSGPTGRHRVRAVAAPEVVDVTGAGDAMLAAFCHALLRGDDEADAASYAHAAAALTVASPHTVRPDLTDRLVRSHA